MFDLTRLAEFAGGFLGQNSSEIDAASILQQLAEQGVEPSQLQDLGADELLNVLSENGVDPSQLGPDQLSTLAENFGVTDHVPEWLSHFTDRAA
ncbi:MAG: hypothetical protein AAGB04_17950 [Pseudomonadota bacterium]